MTALVGIVGGGQLARLTAQAATRLGLKTAVFAPEPLAPAFETAQVVFRADYDDKTMLKRFAKRCDVVTCEFENVPIEALTTIEAHAKLCPSAAVFACAQDRACEKSFFAECGVPCVAWQAVSSLEELTRAVENLTLPVVLKRARGGYDGKGQREIVERGQLAEAWQGIAAGEGETRAIVEQKVDLASEFSLIAAQNARGDCVLFPATENRHEGGILRESRVPATLDASLLAHAQGWTRACAVRLGVVGLLTVEFFLTSEGEVLANEMAPRPHNSGHWTLDAAPVSQFEQLLRAILGWPLASTEPFLPARMVNLLGDSWRDYQRFLGEPDAALHLYAKRETRKGRKMGHVTFRSLAGVPQNLSRDEDANR